MNHFYRMTVLQGTVTSVEPQHLRCSLHLRSGDTVPLHFGAETTFSVLTNLDGISQDRVPEVKGFEGSELAHKVARYLRPQDTVFVRGILSENAGQMRLDVRAVWLLHSEPRRFLFEDKQWCLTQLRLMADSWLDALFGDSRNYTEDDVSRYYRTNLDMYGKPTDDNLQAMPTLSRLIYGLSSAYMLTGDHRYRKAAAAAIQFQCSSFRVLSHDGQYCLWAYGRRKKVNGSVTLFASENGDDFNAIAIYEQIYGLAGLTQYFRCSGDPTVLQDIRHTVAMFDALFLDLARHHPDFPGADGYFSHLDPANLRPDSPALGPRQARKNWNSIGDHLPAYLINLILALEPLPQGADEGIASFLRTCKDMLERTARLIIEKFPDPESVYVNERFHEDWTPDHEWGWQKNRAVVGHNYKIAWQLPRIASYWFSVGRHDEARRALQVAERLARAMMNHGADLVRGGCFDAVERHPVNGQPIEFTWGCTKDFWQQEQAILANLILYGHTRDPEFLDQARAMQGFWNSFFLDRDRQGIFFRTTEEGLPVIEGSYANKAGFAIAGYHSFELNFLTHIYTRAFVAPVGSEDASFCLYFYPSRQCGLRSINVAPDFFNPGTIEIASITVNGRHRSDVDPNRFQIPLQAGDYESEIIVQFRRKS